MLCLYTVPVKLVEEIIANGITSTLITYEFIHLEVGPVLVSMFIIQHNISYVWNKYSLTSHVG